MTARRRPLSWPQVHTLTSAVEAYRAAERRHREAALVVALYGQDDHDPRTPGERQDLARQTYERLLDAIDALGPAGP